LDYQLQWWKLNRGADRKQRGKRMELKVKLASISQTEEKKEQGRITTAGRTEMVNIVKSLIITSDIRFEVEHDSHSNWVIRFYK